MADDTLTIRQMCEEFGVTLRTLRYYDRLELLSPIWDGHKRLFTRSDRARMGLILKWKSFGFELEEIRQRLEMYKPDTTNQAQLASVINLARNKRDGLALQRDELTKSIAEIDAMIASEAA